MGGSSSILISTPVVSANSNKQINVPDVPFIPIEKPILKKECCGVCHHHKSHLPRKIGFGSFKAKVDILKKLIKSCDFQDKFKKFMEAKGKLPYVLCFQKLETLRKILLQEATRWDNTIDEQALKKASSELLSIVDKYPLSTNNMDGKQLPVFNECFKLHVDIHRRGNITSQITLMNRIRLTQEQLLASLFDDFEEFFESSGLHISTPPTHNTMSKDDLTNAIEEESGCCSSLCMPVGSLSNTTTLLSADDSVGSLGISGKMFPGLHNTSSASTDTLLLHPAPIPITSK